MENTSKLLEEINALMLRLIEDFPEIYQFLDEEPYTIPAFAHCEMNFKVLSEYKNSIIDLLVHYGNSHPINPREKNPRKGELNFIQGDGCYNSNSSPL